jgi:hypothetical protein
LLPPSYTTTRDTTLDNAAADVISGSLIRVTAQSNRAPSYSAGFAGTFQLDAEQVAVDLDVVDTPPTSQFLAQQYLMGWRHSFINFIQVSDTPN